MHIGRAVKTDTDPESIEGEEACPRRCDASAVGLQRVHYRLPPPPEERLHEQRLLVERDREDRRLAAMPDELDGVAAGVAQGRRGRPCHDREAHPLVPYRAPVVAVRAAQV